MHIKLLIGVVIVILMGFIGSVLKKDAAYVSIPTINEKDIPGAKNTTSDTTKTETKNDLPSTQIPSPVVVDLSNQNYSKVPSSIFEKTKTQTLDLSHNNLTGALQAEIRFLSALRTLDLSDNQFTGVPAEIGQLKNLEVLDLSNNRLTGLPYELGDLSNLKLLDLRGNDYAGADLEIIKKSLPSSTEIRID